MLPAAGVAQAAASAREPAAAHGTTDPPLRDLVESYAQDAGMEFLPKARLHEGLQVGADALVQPRAACGPPAEGALEGHCG